jgi:hypothetical protein
LALKDVYKVPKSVANLIENSPQRFSYSFKSPTKGSFSGSLERQKYGNVDYPMSKLNYDSAVNLDINSHKLPMINKKMK